jgi:hypothetical protein
MSERFRLALLGYGPSVCSGLVVHSAVGAPPASPPAPPLPPASSAPAAPPLPASATPPWPATSAPPWPPIAPSPPPPRPPAPAPAPAPPTGAAPPRPAAPATPDVPAELLPALFTGSGVPSLPQATSSAPVAPMMSRASRRVGCSRFMSWMVRSNTTTLNPHYQTTTIRFIRTIQFAVRAARRARASATVTDNACLTEARRVNLVFLVTRAEPSQSNPT